VGAQASTWCGQVAGQCIVCILQVAQQARHTFIVGRAFRCHFHLASGAVEQLDLQTRFQLLRVYRAARSF